MKKPSKYTVRQVACASWVLLTGYITVSVIRYARSDELK